LVRRGGVIGSNSESGEGKAMKRKAKIRKRKTKDGKRSGKRNQEYCRRLEPVNVLMQSYPRKARV
jgi:hypothetical protein